MARLPSSFRKNNKTTRSFREQYARLPQHIQQAVRDGCRLFDKDPRLPSLRAHELQNRKQGSHVPNSISISITLQYRAIYFQGEDGVNVWYWVGTHNQYKKFTASKK